MKGLRQCKKTKHFNQKYTNFKNINKINKSEMQKIRCERKELSNLLKSYFKNNNSVVSLINQIEENEQYGPETLNTTIIKELIKNSNLNKYARRYSKTLKEVAFILMSYSPSAYEMLASFIPMPFQRFFLI